MRIGVPKEIKVHEYRVGLTPASARELIEHGHEVLVETGAGEAIGLGDRAYEAAGAQLAPSAEAVFASADMIVKVKEPLAPERARLRAGQILFTYLHLAPDPDQTRDLVEFGLRRDRLRDGHRRAWPPAAACADERGRRPHGDPGRGPFARARPRGLRRAAARRARRRAGQGRDHRRRRGRHQRRDGGARHRRPRRAARALGAPHLRARQRVRPAPRDPLLDDRDPRGGVARCRPRGRRDADPGRRRAQDHPARPSRPDEARLGDRRRRDRPGRLHRNLAPDHPRRARPMWSTASSTTASPTCRAGSPTPRPSRSTT